MSSKVPAQHMMYTQSEGEVLARQWLQVAEKFIEEFRTVLKASLRPNVLLHAIVGYF